MKPIKTAVPNNYMILLPKIIYKKITAFLKYMLFKGTESIEDPFEYCSATICNYLGSLACAVATFFVFFHIFISKEVIGVLSAAPTAILFAFAIYMNHRKNFRFARITLTLSAKFGLTFGAFLLGQKSSASAPFLAAFILYFLILMPEKLSILIAMFCGLLILYLAVELNLYGTFDGQIILTQEQLVLSSLIFKITTIIFIMIGSYYSLYLIKKSNDAKEDSNNQLEKKKNDINSMLQNLNQGIFSVIDEGVIHYEFSKQLQKIFERDDIAGLRLIEIFQSRCDVSSEKLAMIDSAISATIGEAVISFTFNKHILPTNIVFKGSTDEKYLELEWNPILRQDDIVEKLLVSVRDVTELTKANERTKKSETEQKILEEIIFSGIEKFEDSLSEFNSHLDNCLKILESPQNLSKDLVTGIRREFHTLKGESRFVQWYTFSALVHDAEDKFDRIGFKNILGKDEKDWTFDLSEVVTITTELKKQLNRYSNLYNEKIKQRRHQDDLHQNLTWLIDGLGTQTPDVTFALNIVTFLQNEFNYQPIRKIIANQLIEMSSFARQLDKPSPKVVINDNNIIFHKTNSKMLKDVFSHCLKNSIDHGIESEAQRSAAGKNPFGTIQIDIQIYESLVYISMKDDGQGLNLNRLKEIGLKSKMISHEASSQEIASIIFESGLTTKKEITFISGHGIGLDAVKSTLESRGCSIKINPISESSLGFLQFEFIIALPSNFAREKKDFVANFSIHQREDGSVPHLG